MHYAYHLNCWKLLIITSSERDFRGNFLNWSLLCLVIELHQQLKKHELFTRVCLVAAGMAFFLYVFFCFWVWNLLFVCHPFGQGAQLKEENERLKKQVSNNAFVLFLFFYYFLISVNLFLKIPTLKSQLIEKWHRWWKKEEGRCICLKQEDSRQILW